MPPREWEDRIEDMIDAIGKASEYIDGMSFEMFCKDEKTIDAVLRKITVIGEAARHVPEAVQKSHPDLPWLEMKGIRNVVVHEDFQVGLTVLWKTVKEDLPSILPGLRRILSD